MPRRARNWKSTELFFDRHSRKSKKSNGFRVARMKLHFAENFLFTSVENAARASKFAAVTCEIKRFACHAAIAKFSRNTAFFAVFFSEKHWACEIFTHAYTCAEPFLEHGVHRGDELSEDFAHERHRRTLMTVRGFDKELISNQTGQNGDA
jgi:hypothetical protein